MNSRRIVSMLLVPVAMVMLAGALSTEPAMAQGPCEKAFITPLGAECWPGCEHFCDCSICPPIIIT